MIAVPSLLSRTTYEFSGVLNRIAEFEHRDRPSVEKSIIYFGYDIAHLRAANDYLISDSIPLSAGAKMTESARVMVRSSATTAQGTRPEIRGNYSKVGDSYADQTRMGHTEEGSYVIPVMIRVGDAPELAGAEEPFPGMDNRSLNIESPERRITRTFSEALRAVVDNIVEPAREPRQSDVLGLVEAGATREFVQALSNVVSHPAVAEFEARFSWALSQPPSAEAAKSKICPAEAAPLLDIAAKLMKSAPKTEAESISGQIVQVRREPDSPFIHVSLSTVRNSRATEVRITQPSSMHDTTLDWWKGRLTVTARGLIERNSTGLFIRSPQRFGPLSQGFHHFSNFIQ
ncbi:hypothetical protein ACFVWF_32405 [Rhodococcus qingshengii]|uniref:hypothetical protein n=1 Tax=Rhodococcus qingshengii TaxID=334542 RepID=UPI0036DE153F